MTAQDRLIQAHILAWGYGLIAMIFLIVGSIQLVARVLETIGF